MCNVHHLRESHELGMRLDADVELDLVPAYEPPAVRQHVQHRGALGRVLSGTRDHTRRDEFQRIREGQFGKVGRLPMRVQNGASSPMERLPEGRGDARFRGHRRTDGWWLVAGGWWGQAAENKQNASSTSSMASSFPSFASFPEPEEDAPKRSKEKKGRRKREREGGQRRERRKERKRSQSPSRSRSRSRSRERSSKHDRDGERRDKKRHREKDGERRWRPEDDEHDKARQDRVLAEGREPGSTPGAQPWFSDFKGDPLNITYGKLYKGAVPKFWRAGREWHRVLQLVTHLASF
jgi:hypothetical protein